MEHPCIGESYRAKHLQETGRPCPFVRLEAANAMPASLIRFLIPENLRPVAGHAFEALADPRVVDALYPWAKKREAQAARPRRRR